MSDYADGWTRTFRQAEIPDFNEAEIILLTNYKNEFKLEEIIIYLEHYRQITGDMAEFLLRDIMRGVLSA